MQVLEGPFGIDGMVEQSKAKDTVYHDNDDNTCGDPVDDPVLFHYLFP